MRTYGYHTDYSTEIQELLRQQKSYVESLSTIQKEIDTATAWNQHGFYKEVECVLGILSELHGAAQRGSTVTRNDPDFLDRLVLKNLQNLQYVEVTEVFGGGVATENRLHIKKLCNVNNRAIIDAYVERYNPEAEDASDPTAKDKDETYLDHKL